MLSEYRNPLPHKLIAEMRRKAEDAFPKEACGFVVSGELIECRNQSASEDEFAISAEDYATHHESIEVVWHSHRNLARFSEADIRACKTLNIPFAVWDCGSSQCLWVDPRQEAGLINRPWVYGIWDCYSLARDYYYQQYGVQLGDYRREREGEWHLASFTQFEDSFVKEGFRQVQLKDAKEGDVLLFRIRNQHTSNHVAILHDAASNLLLQHLVDRFSGLTAYSHWLRQNTYMVVRHESRW